MIFDEMIVYMFGLIDGCCNEVSMLRESYVE